VQAGRHDIRLTVQGVTVKDVPKVPPNKMYSCILLLPVLLSTRPNRVVSKLGWAAAMMVATAALIFAWSLSVAGHGLLLSPMLRFQVR
jgi:hypothetical protein